MSILTDIKDSLLHLVFPHVCEGCGSDTLASSHFICLQCLSQLPQTFFEAHSNNPVEKLFWGRLAITSASAQYYYTKESVLQQIVHAFKYRGNKALGFYLGQLMGQQLAAANRFTHIDALVPLPLFPSKERSRGFNQSTVLCEGIASILQKPVLKDAMERNSYTESQTKKTRIERWQNIKDRFEVAQPAALRGKHILLVDDIITTGATLEACGREIVEDGGAELSIATLCFSST